MNNRGFTLIELSLVVFLAGTMMFLALPAMRDTLVSDPLATSVNRIVNTANHISNEARRERVDVLLHFDVERGRIWTTSADMTDEAIRDEQERAWQLPTGVRIVDVERFGGELLRDGEVVIRFYSRGYRDPTVVRLARGGDRYTLVFEPFLPKVAVKEGYHRRDRDGTFYRTTSS